MAAGVGVGILHVARLPGAEEGFSLEVEEGLEDRHPRVVDLRSGAGLRRVGVAEAAFAVTSVVEAAAAAEAFEGAAAADPRKSLPQARQPARIRVCLALTDW